MRLLFLFFSGLLIAPPGGVYSQSFVRYGFLEGLENENIVHINQDKSGNLWVATLGGGFSKFNGLEFKNYTVRKGLSHNFVMDVFSSQNKIFAVSDLGISILEGEKFSSPYHHQIVTSALVEESVFFKNENGKLGELRNEVVYSIPFPEDTEGVLAITSLDDVVLVLAKSKNLYELDDNKKLVLLHNFNENDLFLYKGKAIWIGKGPDYLKQRIVIADNASFPVELNRSEIRQVLVQSPKCTWLIHKGKLFLRSGNDLILFSSKDGFTDAEVNYLFKDLEENVWVATGDGLFKIRFSKFQFAGSVDSGDKISAITSIGSDQFLVGTQKGRLFQFRNNSLSPSNLMKGISVHSYINFLFDSVKNSIWLGTGEDGLFRISDNKDPKRIGESKALSEGAVRRMIKHDESTWIGTNAGLVEVDKNDSLNVYQASTGLSDNIIWGIQGTEKGTVVTLTRKGMDIVNGGNVKTVFQQLATKRVTCFMKDSRGNFWIGTLGFGLLFIDEKSGIIKEFTSDDGLNSDVIVNLTQIQGHIYVGTFKGIDVVSLTGDQEVIIRHLSDEIVPTNFNSFYYESTSNKLWFGSNEKCYFYKLGDQKNNPPLVTLQKATITGPSGETILDDFTHDMGKFSHYENNVKFEFLGLNLSNPQAVTYSTRLVGWDSTWTRPVKSRVSSFTNLPPSKYKFEVVAYNHDGIKSANSTSVSFMISRPIWMETWFIASMMIFLTTFGVVIYKYRINRKLSMAIEIERSKQEVLEKIRKNIARDFHDNMGNKLAGIKMYSHLVGLKLKDVNAEASELLAYIERNSQELFEGTKDFIWSIDPESDNLIEVYTYIKDFGEEFFKQTDIKFYSDMNSKSEIIKIPSGWSRQIVLIFKEAMTNTAKHSHGTIARFQMEIDDNKFTFRYCDNGKGFNDSNSQGKGLNNMKSRAEAIKCTIEFGQNQDNELEIKLTGTF